MPVFKSSCISVVFLWKFFTVLCGVTHVGDTTKLFGDEVGIGMAAVLGKVEQYDPELEEWPQYVERLEYTSSKLMASQTQRRSGLCSCQW